MCDCLWGFVLVHAMFLYQLTHPSLSPEDRPSLWGPHFVLEIKAQTQTDTSELQAIKRRQTATQRPRTRPEERREPCFGGQKNGESDTVEAINRRCNTLT